MSNNLELLQDTFNSLPYKQDVGGSSPSLPTSSLNLLESAQFTSEPPADPAGVLIPLTKGYSVLVDPEDYERFGHLEWCAAEQKRNGKVMRVYAKRGVVRPDGRVETIFLHRAIMDAQPGQRVDHEDRRTLNCRRYNLRFATQRQNCFNRIQKISKHGFLGLESQTPGRYRGRVSAGGVNRYTKTYSSAVLAAAARDVLAKEMHGEFCVLNFQFIPVEARP